MMQGVPVPPVRFVGLRFACLCLLWLCSAAAAPLETLEDGGTAKVVVVVDGDTVMLEDGRQVRLVGIQAPKLPLGRDGFEPWPLAEAAKSQLETLALGKTVRLGYGGRRLDRHGRVLAHLTTREGRWLQGEMLRAGLARTFSFRDNRSRVLEMLSLEREARAGRRGVWAEPFYAVRRAEALEQEIGSFQLVDGRVLAAARVRGRIYLNFGADWKTDFTITLDPKTRRLFEAEGIDWAAFEGKLLRVRGWIDSFNGPMIEVSHPEQIELLE